MNRYRPRRLVLALLVGVMSIGGVAGGAPVPFSSSVLASSTITTFFDPEIEGDTVVWTQRTLIGLDSSRYVGVRDLVTGMDYAIGVSGSHQERPDVSLGRIAYQDSRDGNANIRIWDNDIALDYAVTTSGNDEVAPRIDGNLVVWLDDDTGELWYRDLYRGFSAKVPGATNVNSMSAYDVDNGRVVWAGGLVTQEIRMFTPGISEASLLLWTAPAMVDIDSVQMHGDKVAFTYGGANDDALVVDVRSLIVDNVNPASAFDEVRPVVFHKGVAWETTQGGTADVFFRMLGDSFTNVAGSTAWEGSPAIFGRRIVYEYFPGGETVAIHMASGTPESVRTSGANRYETAVEVSKAYFSKAEHVVLCTGGNFPDALAAAPFARLLRAPLLLTRSDAVDTATIAEMKRLGATTIWIIGGTSVITTAVQTQLMSEGWDSQRRIAGDNRYETSVEIAGAMDEILGGPYDVRSAFFARGDSFPDALAVGPVAAGAFMPILLVQGTTVPASVGEAVDSMNLTSGIIVGGSSAVSASVRNELRSLMIANGGDAHDPQIVDRWAGADRYETAVAVVEGGLEARWIDLDTLGVATALDFPDALGGGAALGYYGSPLVLTGPTSLPQSVADFLDEHQYRIGRVDVFGGTSVVSNAVKTAVSNTLK